MSQKLIWGLLPDDSNHPRIEFGEDTETHEAFLKINGQEIKNYEPETPSEPEVPDTPDTPVEPITIELMQLVTWQELKNLRDEGRLVPGQSYRIIDYKCSTTQDNTRALSHQFDIIVSAISHNTLSESARVDFHKGDSYFKHEQVEKIISSEINMQQQLTIIPEGVITPEWVIYEDGGGSGYNEEGEWSETNSDKFIAFDFLSNNDGVIVPVLYKTDIGEYSPEEPDTESPYFYVGEESIDGISYDKWRKIEYNATDGENKYTWTSESKQFILTNKIVGEGLLIDATVLVEVEEAYVSANLPAWKIKYCLDNDVSRFAWAANKPSILVGGNWYEYVRHTIVSNQYNIWWERKDKTLDNLSEKYILSKCNMDGGEEEAYFTDSLGFYPSDWTRVVDIEDRIEHGKGVIYFMQDERGNQCGYDFKNIQFLRKKLVSYNKNTEYRLLKSSDDLVGVPLYDFIVPDIQPTEFNLIWYYTFSIEKSGGDIEDASVVTNRDLYRDNTSDIYSFPCINNKIEIFVNDETSDEYNTLFTLPNNVFCEQSIEEGDTKRKFFENNVISQSKNNTFSGSTKFCVLKQGSNGNIIIKGSNHLLSQQSENNYLAQNCSNVEMNRAIGNYLNHSCYCISMNHEVCGNIVEAQSSHMYFKDGVEYVYVTDNSQITAGVSYIVVDMGIAGGGMKDSDIKQLTVANLSSPGQYTILTLMNTQRIEVD